MKRIFPLVALLALGLSAAYFAFAGTPGSVPGTLYQQEGTSADGPAPINAAGHGPSGIAGSSTNWLWQSGSGAYKSVYAGTAGELITSGDPNSCNVDVEADVEMFISQTVENNHIYFHIGNMFVATQDDLTAYIPGTVKSNGGEWIGLYMPHKRYRDFDFTTGRIAGGMYSERNALTLQDEIMDLEIQLSDGVSHAAGYFPPVGYGAHASIVATLWWEINGGIPGSYNLSWRVRLLPRPDQPDGDYYLDPIIVCAPIL